MVFIRQWKSLAQSRGNLTEPRAALCVMLTAWWAHPTCYLIQLAHRPMRQVISVARFTAEEQRGIKLRGQHHAAEKDRSWDLSPGNLKNYLGVP